MKQILILVMRFTTDNSVETHIQAVPQGCGAILYFASSGLKRDILQYWSKEQMEHLKSYAKVYGYFSTATKYVNHKFRSSTAWLTQLIDKVNSILFMHSEIDTFKKSVEKKERSLLMAICRDKSAEGIDFPHDCARMVMVASIPFASINAPSIHTKMQYLVCTLYIVEYETKYVPYCDNTDFKNVNLLQ